MKTWQEIVHEDFSPSEKQIVQNMKKELKKLLGGFGSELGLWLDKKSDAIKHYLPEIYDIMFYPIMDKANGGGPNTTKQQYSDFANAFKNELKKSGVKL